MLITLIASFSLVACSADMPKPPDVKNYYLVDVAKDGSFSCIRFKIVSFNPYKIQFDKQVPNSECHMIAGYTPDDTKKVLNWVEDVIRWAEQKLKSE